MSVTTANPNKVQTDPLIARELNLRRYDFSFKSMCGSDFVLSDLTEAVFAGCDLSYSNASGATIRHANMQNVNARAVNFSLADLQYTDFTEADLTAVSDSDTLWNGAILTRAILPEGWTYEEFVEEVAPNFFIACGKPLKSIVSDRGWTTGPIELAYPKGVPITLKPVEKRMRIFMQSGHLRRAQVTSALRRKGALR